MRRAGRIVLLTIALWVAENVAQTWGGQGSFTYPQARWDGHRWIYSGRMITVCDWRCYLGIDPPKGR